MTFASHGTGLSAYVIDARDIVRAAIPDADDAVASAILWERTCFPCGPVTARELYRAASRYRRVAAQGLWLCDWCDRIVGVRPGLCPKCSRALRLDKEGK